MSSSVCLTSLLSVVPLNDAAPLELLTGASVVGFQESMQCKYKSCNRKKKFSLNVTSNFLAKKMLVNGLYFKRFMKWQLLPCLSNRIVFFFLSSVQFQFRPKKFLRRIFIWLHNSFHTPPPLPEALLISEEWKVNRWDKQNQSVVGKKENIIKDIDRLALEKHWRIRNNPPHVPSLFFLFAQCSLMKQLSFWNNTASLRFFFFYPEIYVPP